MNKELHEILSSNKTDMLDLWKKQLFTKSKQLVELIGLEKLKARTEEFLDCLIEALPADNDVQADAYKGTRTLLRELSKELTVYNLTPSETAMFVFSIKEAIFPILQSKLEARQFAQTILIINTKIDQLGLMTFETYLNIKENLIHEQQRAFMEVSVPVVRVWNKILMVPLMGMLDSSRTELMLETLLDSIEKTQAKVAILDISGIPVVDSLVAGHLIKAASATRLMGADCIITGIGSKISQTMVHLGINLSEIVSKTTLEEGLKLAFKITGQNGRE